MRLAALFLFFSLPLFAQVSEDEELFIRRIESMSCEEEGPFLRHHIEEFCQKYPQSHARERFIALLGHIAFQEKHYEEAIGYYESINDPALKKAVQGKKWHSLYLLSKSADLLLEITPAACDSNPEARFYYAQALYSEGLKKNPRLMEESLVHFESLLNHPDYCARAKLALAEIYHHLGHPSLASQYYVELADELEKGGQGQEEALFKAAVALKDADEARSLKIASHLTRFGLHIRKQAAHLWLYLLIRGGLFEEIALHEEELLSTLPEEKKSLCHACLGKIYFEKKEFSKAALHLDHVTDSSCDLMKAIVYGKVGQYEKALRCVDKKSDPSSLLQKTKLHLMKGDLEEALKSWKELPLTQESLRLRVEIAQAEGAPDSLIQALEAAFASPETFSKEEHLYYTLVLAKAYLAAKEGEKAIALLKQIEEEIPEKEFLLSLACFQMGEYEKGVFHGEKALQDSDESLEKKKLHLSLFNAYRALKLEHPDEEYTSKAAHHLFAAQGGAPISEENLLWLAHFFMKKYETTFERSCAEKAIAIYTSLLRQEEAFFDFEKEAIDLASLHMHLKETHEAGDVLKRLFALQEKAPEYPWKAKGRALLVQASLDVAEGNTSHAFALYSALCGEKDKKIATPAKLHLARLQLKEGNVTAALDALQEIQREKNPLTEPCHLEAAIDRATYLASLFPPESAKKRLASLLIEVKEEFDQQEDIASKDYHRGLERFPEKGRLYQAYLRFLDAKITQLQAEVAKSEGNLLDARTKEKAAFALFSSLRSTKYSVTDYLKERSAEGHL